MSVVGFDIGNDTSCVALARKRGIDVIMNKESKRETPTVISFGEKMRYLGTDGAAKLSMNPKSTVYQIKRLIGKKFSDPQVQSDIQKLPYKVLEAPDGGVLVEVQYCNETATFSPEQLLAMVFVDLKKIAEGEAGITLTDCVVGVPAYYTEAERYATLNAAQIAGVNCLRLMNETTATALAYGIYKTDLPETDPVHVAFVDVGHASTQVSIVAFKKGQLQVKTHSWDRSLGGRDFDEVLFNYFSEEFKEKTKQDVMTNAKAAFKLRLQCEKLKKVLSANSEAPINVECLMNDMDLKSKITRELFEQLSQPLLERFRVPLQQAVAAAGIPIEELASVEVVGSSTRMPSLFRLIEEAFGKTPSRTMNAKECVSRGCALQCAMLSPIFRVRDFEVIDSCPYTIVFNWEKDGEATSQRLFEKGSAIPAAKMLTFLRSQPFSIAAAYAQDADVPVNSDSNIGVYSIGPFTIPAGMEKAKLKVKVRMNLHGLVSAESAQAVEEEEVQEEVKPAAEAGTDAAAAVPAAGEAANGTAAAPPDAVPMDSDSKEKKKRVRRTDVPLATTTSQGYSKQQLDDYFEKEGQMQAADKLQEETNEKKNALEAYVYALRNKLSDSLAAYAKPDDRDSVVSSLNDMEDWLYDEGEDQTKSVYIAKLEELKKLGNPIEIRFNEDQARPAAAEALKQTCDVFVGLATSDAQQYAHLTAAEKDQVIRECQTAVEWLNDKLQLQAQLRKYDDPVIFAADIAKKRDVVERVCKPIFSRPPPPKEAKREEPQPMDADASAAGENAAGDKEEVLTDASPQAQPMEQ